MKKFIRSVFTIVFLLMTIFAFSQTNDSIAQTYNRTLKFELLSPLAGDFALGYEQKISPILNGELKVGFIYEEKLFTSNSFFLNTQSDRGFFTKIGLKLITKGNNFPIRFYIKPEFIYSSYSGTSLTEGFYFPDLDETAFTNKSLGSDLAIGFQSTFAKRFFTEGYFGMGWVATSLYYGKTTTILSSASSVYALNNSLSVDGYLPNFGFGGLGFKSYSQSNSHEIFTFGMLIGYSFK